MEDIRSLRHRKVYGQHCLTGQVASQIWHLKLVHEMPFTGNIFFCQFPTTHGSYANIRLSDNPLRLLHVTYHADNSTRLVSISPFISYSDNIILDLKRA